MLTDAILPDPGVVPTKVNGFHNHTGFDPPCSSPVNGLGNHISPTNGHRKLVTPSPSTSQPTSSLSSNSTHNHNNNMTNQNSAVTQNVDHNAAAKAIASKITAASLHRNKWYCEYILPNLYQACVLKETLHWAKSEFQELEILNLDPFGQCLILDKRIQSASLDEFIYHEGLVHPAMLAHPNPKTVFIGGGGEGATAREVLKHKSVEKVVMVDIDKEVVEQCIEHLRQHHAGSFNDSRLEIHYDDAKKILEEYKGKFDVIILDLADPMEEGPCYLLYTVKFYEMVKTKLNPGGVFITQSGPASLLTMNHVFTPIYKTLGKVWGERVYPSMVHIPAFADYYGFNLTSDVNVKEIQPEQIDKLIAERIEGGASALRFYDGEAHRGMYSVPKYVRVAMEAEDRIITEQTPLYVMTGDY